MLAVLVGEPPPILHNPWRQPRPPLRALRQLELAPGIWICRTKQWTHTSVFDTHADLPLHVDLPDIPTRTLPYPEWHQWALCSGMPASAFFGADSDERPTMKRSELSAARRVCAACEVKSQCLEWALNPATREKHGVWGGTSGRQRAVMRKKLAAGQGAASVIGEWFEQWLAT